MFELRPYHKNNRVSVYNPFKEMEDMEKSFFGGSLSDFFRNGDLSEFKTDITDEGDHYLLDADMPGFDKKDIHLELDGDMLTISAERHSEKETKDKGKYICSERSYGRYSRAFDVSTVDADNIKAKYDNGVLHLTLPKKEKTAASQAKHLEIE